MITTRRLAALTALTWLALGMEANAGSTYQIAPYPTITSPYTVSGTITTNGDTGTDLSASDITAWDIKFSNGSSNFELTQANSSAVGAFNATPTEITPAVGTLEFAMGDLDIAWVPSNGNTHDYIADNGLTSLWLGQLPSPNSPIAINSAVPEPSTAVLAGIGAAGLIASVLVRKRREQRPQAAS